MFFFITLCNSFIRPDPNLHHFSASHITGQVDKTSNGFLSPEELLSNSSSFLYGRDPSRSPVPVYAVVTLCDAKRLQRLERTSPAAGAVKVGAVTPGLGLGRGATGTSTATDDE